MTGQTGFVKAVGDWFY